MLITFAATSLAEGILAAVVRASYSGLGLPLWEAGISAFFIGLPIDMAVNAGVHTAMMRIPPGKGIEVWFVQRVMLLGVTPEYRRPGLEPVLIREIHRRAAREGIRRAELSWVLEDNALMNRTIRKAGGRHYKTYRIYAKRLSW